MNADQVIGIVSTVRSRMSTTTTITALLELIADHSTREPDCIDIFVHRGATIRPKSCVRTLADIERPFVPEQMSKRFIAEFTERTRAMVLRRGRYLLNARAGGRRRADRTAAERACLWKAGGISLGGGPMLDHRRAFAVLRFGRWGPHVLARPGRCFRPARFVRRGTSRIPLWQGTDADLAERVPTL